MFNESFPFINIAFLLCSSSESQLDELFTRILVNWNHSLEYVSVCRLFFDGRIWELKMQNTKYERLENDGENGKMVEIVVFLLPLLAHLPALPRSI